MPRSIERLLGLFPLVAATAIRATRQWTIVLMGLEYRFTDHFTGYGGFTTDRSAAARGTDTRHSASTWDVYHISSGAALSFSGLYLTLGVRYSFGSRALEESYRSVPSDPRDPLAGGEAVFRAWKGIIGFAFSI